MDGRVAEGRRKERQTGQRISHAFVWPKLIQKAARSFPKDLAASFDSPSLVHWSPVAFGAGILVYFSAAVEPSRSILIGCAIAAIVSALLAGFLFSGRLTKWIRLAPAMAALAFACAGFSVGVLRTQSVASPRISAPIGPIAVEGWVERDDAGPRMRRVLLQVDWLEGYSKSGAPHRIQIATPWRAGVTPGRYVNCFVSLTPPPAPVTPGGYDFARNAYFSKIGASGYSLRACEPAPAPRVRAISEKLSSWLAAIRRAMTIGILEKTQGGSAAGFVAALATGDESGIAQADVKALQVAGLAHLLAVSGMNMTLVGGSVFLIVRYAASVMGVLPLYIPIRAVAAISGLIACVFYWALTGGGAATSRAFVMAAIAFGAVLINRPAITMRGLALAAFCLLIVTPEALMSPGFQMSFAATIGLIAAFESYRDYRTHHVTPGGGQRRLWLVPGAIFAAFLTTMVAGSATAPYSAYHFQTFATYGFLANMAASPLISLIVTPACILAVIAAPFGLSGLPLRVAEWGAQQIIAIANWAAAQPDAVTPVAAFHPIWVLIFTLGLLCACLLRNYAKLICLLPFLISAVGIASTQKPLIIISADAKTIIAATPKLIVRSAGNPDSFEQIRFRQAMGINPKLELKTLSDVAMPSTGTQILKLRDGGTLVLSDEKLLSPNICGLHTIVVAQELSSNVFTNCTIGHLLDMSALTTTGGVAVYSDSGAYRIESVKKRRGARPWTISSAPTF